MNPSAIGLPPTIEPLSPAGFGIGGLTTPPIVPTVSLPLDIPSPQAGATPESNKDLDAADLMTIKAMLGLLIEARAGFASTDRTVKRQATMDLVRLHGYLTGFFDSKGAIKATPPADGFAGLFVPSVPPPLDVALDQLQAALASLVAVTPTRRPNKGKIADNILGDSLLAIGAGMVVTGLANLFN